jgi:hypothetical protein
MTCQWCEADEYIIKLCDIEDHIICNDCYEKYHKNYPKRIKGCPYCKGTEEVLVITQPLINNIRVSPSSSRENSYDTCARSCYFCCSITCIWGLLYTTSYLVYQ